MRGKRSIVGAVLVVGISLSGAPACAGDEIVVNPGSDLLGAIDLTPCTAIYKNFSRKNQLIGTITTTMKPGTVRNRSAYWWICTIESAKGTVVDSIAFDPSTLEPLYRSFPHSSKGYHYLSLDGKNVRGIVRPPDGGAPARVEMSFEQPVFEASQLDVVLAALPLEEGYAVKLPCANYGKRKIMWATAEVRRSETVSAENGEEFDAWVVDLSFSGGGSRTLWIVNASPFRVQSANGWNWRLVEVNPSTTSRKR